MNLALLERIVSDDWYFIAIMLIVCSYAFALGLLIGWLIN